jgi:molybdopterin synthase catalytic subunit
LKILVQQEDFDVSLEIRALSKNPSIGAVASFVGVVREVAMTLEHYPGMTENSIKKIAEEARSRWQVIDCTVIHRYGDLQPNDQIVLVAVASAHRGDAFAACEFIMDYLKTAGGARWVEAKSADDDAAERWRLKQGVTKP